MKYEFENTYPLKNERFLKKEEIGEALKAYRENARNTKKDKSILFKVYSSTKWYAAASIVAIIGYFACNVTVKSGDTIATYALPDSSVVTLQNNSQISYNKIAWLFNRKVRHSGDAHYDVMEGSTFTVSTGIGSVKVLGTVFSVNNSDDEVLVVACTKGRVGVTSDFGDDIVNAGEKGVFSKHGIEKSALIPPYLDYSSIPISQILQELALIYNISFDTQMISDDIHFTGRIPTDDIDNALSILCGVCGIDFTKDDNNVSFH